MEWPVRWQNVLAVAGLLDHVARRLVDLPALQRLARGEGRAHPRDGRVAGRGHDLRRSSRTSAGTSRADEAGPRQVAVDGPRPVALGPQVDQHEVALADRRVAARRRLVVRVAAVRADARRSAGDRSVEPCSREVVEDALLHLGLARRVPPRGRARR